MTSGIYEILNTVNGKRYIGSAQSFPRRQREHTNRLRAGNHHNARLQNAWNKYSESAFVFALLFECAVSELVQYEQAAMDHLQPEYNLSPTAGSPLGVKHSPAVCEAKRQRALGRVMSVEARAAIGRSKLGKKRKPFSDEWKQKMGLSRLGKKRKPYGLQTTEQRLAKSLALRGKKKPLFSAAHRAKMSANALANPRPRGEDGRFA